MGLAWKPQFLKLKSDPRFSRGMVHMVIPSEGGSQETCCIPLRKLPGWLMTISPNKVKPEIRLWRRSTDLSDSSSPVIFGNLLTIFLQEAKLGLGARNTKVGGPRPERSGFFVPRFSLPSDLSALACRACDEYKTLRGNQSAAPTAVSSARRPFRASPHRLEIDSRRVP